MSSFSGFHWLIMFLVLGIAYVVLKKVIFSDGGKESICPSCGTQGTPKTVVRGNIVIELILWLCFLIPGLIYSVWRASSKYKACPACGQRGMIPLDTPNGKRLADQQRSQA